ncbi:MAG: diaminopropionate ammonia-lyase, partial [Firmicutes bacterium]|nr:diaminopropionate ammonia-lyase [Bacillota bacterium]
MYDIEWTGNRMTRTDDAFCSLMAPEKVERAARFHQSFPQYAPTPLANLRGLAERFGLGGVYIKDESFRFGLNAFKVLGGSYAVARYIAKLAGENMDRVDYARLTSASLWERLGQATFFTATDGNHGRGVAWTARQLGQKAVVYMPKGSSRVRFDNIRAEGAAVTIENANYDECVRIAGAAAQKTPGGVIVQDTAWEGYKEIPTWIMQGYGTMAAEAAEQLGRRPTHIFVQAGVGSLAGAVQGYFANIYRDDPPVVTVIEADEAACLYLSVKAADGAIHAVGGDMPTIMAGLACGE